jgi:hypothetical protein
MGVCNVLKSIYEEDVRVNTINRGLGCKEKEERPDT